tara:strand:- start:2067 stop:3389 length:1323 start_codon:yes stop_codon:yes gene_type:complete
MNPFDTAWNLLKELSDEDLEYAAQFGGLRDAANRYKGKMTEAAPPKVSQKEMLDMMAAHLASKPDKHGRKPDMGIPIEDLVGEEPKPVEWPGDKGPPVTMGTIDRKGRHATPKKVSTEQNIAQLLGGGVPSVDLTKPDDPDEFTVDAPKGGKRGDPSQEYWSDLFSGPMGGQGLDEGEASRAELEEGGLNEGEEADPDVRDTTFDTYHQDAPDPTIDTSTFESPEHAGGVGTARKYRQAPETAGADTDYEADALWPHEVHREREAQAHEGELDAMHAAMSAINPDHRSPIGHIPGEGTHGAAHDMLDRAANRPEPLEEAMKTLQYQHDPATQGDINMAGVRSREAMGRTTLGDLERGEPGMHGEPFHPDLEQFLPEQQEEPEESFDEDPMTQATSTLEPERNVQTQSRINPRGPPPAPGSPNYEQDIAAWRAGQKKRGRR